MKLSVCIPVYNFDIRELVYSLNKQISEQSLPAEIIIIDDASHEEFKSLNSEIQNITSQFIPLDKNIGRSKIRNLFLQFAKGEYLLFLDCDGKIISNHFLENYLNFIQENQEKLVIYGGRKVMEKPLDEFHTLRWKFAVERENIPVEKRNTQPFLSFQTNNFVIKKETLEIVQFNAEYNKYGYEDLLFAMDLKSENIIIHHINNPILNNDIESNAVYLQKVKESVESVSSMLKNKHTNNRISDIKLIKAFKKINIFPFNSTVRFCFSVLKKHLEKQLLKGDKSLRYLDFYKLGLLFEMMK